MKIQMIRSGTMFETYRSHGESLIKQGIAREYKGDADYIKDGKEYKFIPSDNGISETLAFIRNSVQEAYETQ